MTDCTCNNFPASLGNVTFGASVGIGTTSPATLLDVVGGAAPQILVDSGGAASAFLEFDNGAASRWQLGSPNAGGSDLVVQKVGTGEFLRVTAAGNVGIGTSSPGFKLDVVGNLQLTDTSAETISLAYPGYDGVYLRNYQGQLYIYHGPPGPSPATWWDTAGNIALPGSITAGGRKVADAGGCYYA